MVKRKTPLSKPVSQFINIEFKDLFDDYVKLYENCDDAILVIFVLCLVLMDEYSHIFECVRPWLVSSKVVAMVQSCGYKVISAKIFMRKQKPLMQTGLLEQLTLPINTMPFL